MERFGTKIVYGLVAVLLMLAPVFRAGMFPLALGLLEILGIALLFATIWNPRFSTWGEPRQMIVIVALVLLPLLYLVPLPSPIADIFPGTSVFRNVQSLVSMGQSLDFRTLSVVPVETEKALLTLLPPIAVFIAVKTLDLDLVWRLIHLVIGIAAVQALIGLMQFGSDAESILFWGVSHPQSHAAVGTYMNRNHLAGLMELVLPVAIALFIANLGRRSPSRVIKQKWRRHLSFFGSIQGHKTAWYAVTALLLLLGAVFTRSRAGNTLVLLGIVIVTLGFSRRLGGTNVFGATGTIVATGLGFAIAIGLTPILDRFTTQDFVADARWDIFSRTLTAIVQSFPLGFGPGSFQEVFAAYQPVALGQWIINRAHNDYLEWIFEAGVFAVILLVYWLWLFTLRWYHVWRTSDWNREQFARAGAGIGLLLLMLHELADYNLRTPANMIFFAFWTAIFFHPEFVPVKKERRRRTQEMASTAAKGGYAQESATTISDSPASAVAKAKRPLPLDQIKNPFLD